MENLNTLSSGDLLDDKKRELQDMREQKLKGNIVRSRAQWLHNGEKPSKLFCALESFNYTEKTVKRIKTPNKCIVDQKEILNELKCFYEKLFRNQTKMSNDIDLNAIVGEKNDTSTLSHEESLLLEGPLEIHELGIALNSMKNGKSPGIDGFPAEFFKVFWAKMKIFILRSLNHAYITGEMSTTLRQCIITCLLKGNKPREFLKNWRPISLLSVIYKIGSTAIANRIKKILDKIISKNQAGFVKGRFIGENTRLIYDLMHFTEKHKIPGLLMLIDFEKAFDSVSWKFLYSVLEFLGFGSGFIKWIKMFNNNITASIIQCGFLSDPINIERGCRQGDPIASYLFLMCAQVLLLLVKFNKDIVGITIDHMEYKLTQFADDTTLILDGSVGSLLAALNTLEIFGTLSGLKINTDKTKLVWIGKKRYSKDKLDIKEDFIWGATEFSFLGIMFSVNLSKMVDLNFELVAFEIETIVNRWKNRHLTPLGKVTVIKTLLLPKLTHLFMSIPSPNVDFILKMNKTFYNFIWDGKPDKVSRDLLCKGYLEGGLKMINLKHFIKSLKLTWLRRIYVNVDAPWIKLAISNTGPRNKLLFMGPQWSYKCAGNTTNIFWKDVLFAWGDFMTKLFECCEPYENICGPLWYNQENSHALLFEPSLYQKGIISPIDLLTKDGNILTLEEIHTLFNSPINFLTYHRIYSTVKNYLQKIKPTDQSFEKPFMLPQIKVLTKSSQGSKDLYNILVRKGTKQAHNYITKWTGILKIDLDKIYWTTAHKICFHTICDNTLIWFQYRVIHRLLGTKQYLHKIHYTDSSLCSLCSNDPETMVHLFLECEISKIFWENVQIWLMRKGDVILSLDLVDILFGKQETTGFYSPCFCLNVIYIVGKYYIYWCSRNKRKPHIFEFQNYLKQKYNEQEYLSRLEAKHDKFCKKWVVFQNVFQ